MKKAFFNREKTTIFSNASKENRKIWIYNPGKTATKVELTPVAFSDLSSQNVGENSTHIRDRIIGAREKQEQRFKENPGTYANAQMSSKLLK